MILESKKCHGHLDVLYWLILIAEIWQLIQTFLHLMLDPVTEGFNATKVFLASDKLLLHGPVEELQVQKRLIELCIEDELDGVVTCCDSFYVPFDISALLLLFNVVDIVDDREAQEDYDTAEK